MDTKLKKFNENKLVKTMAFLLCIILFTGSFVTAGMMAREMNMGQYQGDMGALLQSKTYEESDSIPSLFSEKLQSVLDQLSVYKSEEYIRSGKSIAEERLEEQTRNLFFDELNNNGYIAYSQDGSTADLSAEELPQSTQNNARAYTDDDYDTNPALREQFKKDHGEEIEALKKQMISEDLRSFKDCKTYLDSKGFTYYASNGVDMVSNVSKEDRKAESFKKNQAYVIYKNGDIVSSMSIAGNDTYNRAKVYENSMLSRLDDEMSTYDGLTVYMGIDAAFISQQAKEFKDARADILGWIPIVGGASLLTILLFGYLIVTTGRRDDIGRMKFWGPDYLFAEIKLVAAVIAAYVSLSALIGGVINSLNTYLSQDGYYSYGLGNVYPVSSVDTFNLIAGCIGGAAAAAVALWFILSCVRDLKGKAFLERLLVFRVGRAVYHSIMDLYHGGSIMRKIVLITLGICLLSATVFFAPVMFILVLIFAPKWVKKYEEIQKGVEEVRKGNVGYKIKVEGMGELTDLVEGINDISAASNVAIQNELKNQRMKTDLISNVSHDLKTPLTSIITYVDLLKEEGLTCEDAPKYLDILDQKSQRLRQLTEDLFDAAKASSGAIPVNFERVEMLSLIYQGLGEMRGSIEACGLDVKISAAKDKYYVRADSQLIWRVVENLLGNVIKYAQEGSRVYIDLKEQAWPEKHSLMVIMEMKNISKNELNIAEEELMERFKRGDESRNTEGSGLGLAIAKDLVKLQNGRFEIKIDGDLFKAITMLEGYKDDEPWDLKDESAE